MVKIAGIDIGSRTIKLVILEDSVVSGFKIVDTGYNPLAQCQSLLSNYRVERIIATGYGRHLAGSHFADEIVTEIKAHAKGAHYLFPKCRTVIDIGGQDSKVIRVKEDGSFGDFELNDKCAAGTGKFLEVMAQALGFSLTEFGEQALQADKLVEISSMCTVFAESEVISLISKGEEPKNIALGLHQAVVERIFALAAKVGLEEDIVFVGGVAKNRCIGYLLPKKINHKIIIPDEPQLVGALGAALEGQKWF